MKEANANDNLAIWDRVKETPPQHTKKVEYGARRFTAVDAYYQIRRATELWGPLGIGWGYDVDLLEKDDCYLADFRLWYRSGERKSEPIRVFGIESKFDKTKQKLDLDAPKKAVTDALTKALSYLGFSADVFLGRYDDNRYVAEMLQKYKSEGGQGKNTGNASRNGQGPVNGSASGNNSSQHSGQSRRNVQGQSQSQNQGRRNAGEGHQGSGPKPFNAKFAGTCTVCGGEINAGDVIYWSNEAGTRHADCYQGR